MTHDKDQAMLRRFDCTPTKPATFGVTKRAWIRTPGQPIGKPGLGKINCPCGQMPETNFRPGPDIACPCGTVYTWDGYIVTQEELEQ